MDQIAPLGPGDLGRGVAAVGAARHPHRVVEIEVEIEAEQTAGGGVVRLRSGADQELLSGAQPARVVHGPERLHRGVGLGRGNARATQDVHERVAALHRDMLGRPSQIG